MKNRSWKLLIFFSIMTFLCGCSFYDISSEKRIPKFKISNYSSKKVQLMKEYMFCRKYCSKHYIINLTDDPSNSNGVILSWKGMTPSPAVVTIKNSKTGKVIPVNLKSSEASLHIGEPKKSNEFQIHFEWGKGRFRDQVTRVIKFEK